jgi:DNA invertase Pin-like site-specific DNA recombinase
VTARRVKLNLGRSNHDPTDAMGKLLFTTLAMIAEFEADLTRMRTREGMKIAKAKGRLRGKAPSERETRGASGGPAQGRRVHQRRAGRPVRRGPLDGLPRDRACRRRVAGTGTLTPPMADILAAMADITRKTVDECHLRRSLGPGGQGRAEY